MYIIPAVLECGWLFIFYYRIHISFDTTKDFLLRMGSKRNLILPCPFIGHYRQSVFRKNVLSLYLADVSAE